MLAIFVPRIFIVGNNRKDFGTLIVSANKLLRFLNHSIITIKLPNDQSDPSNCEYFSTLLIIKPVTIFTL